MSIEKGSINKYDKNSVNSLMLILYIFSSTVTLPLKELFHSGVFLWIITLLILATSLYVNNFEFNKAFLSVVFIVLVIFILNYLFLPYKSEIQFIFIEFLKFGLIPLYLSTFIKDSISLLKYWYILGVICLCIWVLFLGEINSRELNYMTFGRHMTLCFIVFTIYFYSGKRKALSFVLMLVSLLLIGLFANRSVIIICVLCLLFFQIRSLKQSNLLIKYVKILAYLLVSAVLIFNIERLILSLNNLLQDYGINSYPLRKAMMLIRSGFFGAISGRDSLYEEAINIITSNNYMPKGIGYYQNITGIIYPHNIFLDILIMFGFFGLIFFVLILIFGFLKVKKVKSPSLKIIMITLFIYAAVLLNLSGTFWSEEVFWVLIGLLITSNYSKTNVGLIASNK